mmetsp:Transcript_67154/g.186009  ORF Transcript_67154/g.186009 Transcript_67154/m.186009 type:complete len:353 (-) Transcript_67154:245-1303(-)
MVVEVKSDKVVRFRGSRGWQLCPAMQQTWAAPGAHSRSPDSRRTTTAIQTVPRTPKRSSTLGWPRLLGPTLRTRRALACRLACLEHSSKAGRRAWGGPRRSAGAAPPRPRRRPLQCRRHWCWRMDSCPRRERMPCRCWRMSRSLPAMTGLPRGWMARPRAKRDAPAVYSAVLRVIQALLMTKPRARQRRTPRRERLGWARASLTCSNRRHRRQWRRRGRTGQERRCRPAPSRTCWTCASGGCAATTRAGCSPRMRPTSSTASARRSSCGFGGRTSGGCGGAAAAAPGNQLPRRRHQRLPCSWTRVCPISSMMRQGLGWRKSWGQTRWRWCRSLGARDALQASSRPCPPSCGS